MTIRDALDMAVKELKIANIKTPTLEAGALLCYVMKCDKAFIYAHSDYILSESERIFFFDLVKQRIKGKPFQYIVGNQEFMSLNFKVTPDVLIPRNDTEILVETIINKCKDKDKDKVNIIDVGTGSGCIAVSLAHYIKNCHVVAVDISREALKVAKFNALLNKVENKITFFNLDILSSSAFPFQISYFDVIVSNPPYISSDEILVLQKEVREYEPSIALDGGRDGLAFYKKISEIASKYLKIGGIIAFEVGYKQSQLVSDIIRKNFHEIEVIKDLSGIDRVVLGKGTLLQNRHKNDRGR
jgi:release factor glutamine methyltransferase